MNRELIELAKATRDYEDEGESGNNYTFNADSLERFAQLVAEQERATVFTRMLNMTLPEMAAEVKAIQAKQGVPNE